MNRLQLALLSGVILGTMFLPVSAFADRPEGGSSQGPVWKAGSPGTFITVTPSDGLLDGQVVMVSGTGFGPNHTISLFECSIRANLCVPKGTTATNGDGDFSPTAMSASNTFSGHTCQGARDCIVEAVDFSADIEPGVCCVFANHHLSFRPH